MKKIIKVIPHNKKDKKLAEQAEIVFNSLLFNKKMDSLVEKYLQLKIKRLGWDASNIK